MNVIHGCIGRRPIQSPCEKGGPTSNGVKGGSAQKPLTNVRTGWIRPREERDHLNIEKLQHVPALICYNAHSLLTMWKNDM